MLIILIFNKIVSILKILKAILFINFRDVVRILFQS